MTKVLVYSEILYPPFDEGIKKTAYQTLRTLSKQKVDVVGIYNGNKDFRKFKIKGIQTNRLLLSSILKKEIKKFSPDIILYIPSASGSLWSFFRGWVLKRYIKNKQIIMILLQPRKYSKLKRLFIKLFKPHKILTPSEKVLFEMRSLGIESTFFALGVDSDQFKPVRDKKHKKELRQKYKIPENKFIVLHVGHIVENRNLEVLSSLQGGDNQILIIGSTSTPSKEGVDQNLKNKLENDGIIVITNYISNIEEIYQLSDLYVFPVRSESGVISIPLSILEAMACNLPILTTKIAALPKMFKEDNEAGFYYYSNEKQFKEKFKHIKMNNKSNTMDLIKKYSWEKSLQSIYVDNG